MKNVLVVTYFYPPRNTIRSVMISKLTKYLPEYGWQPTILTATPPPGATLTSPVELPEEYVVRARCWYPLRPLYLRWRAYRTARAAHSTAPAVQASSNSGQSLLALLARSRLWRRLIFLLIGEKPGWYPDAMRQARRLLLTRKFDALCSASGPYTVNIIASRIQAISQLPWVAEFPDLWSQNHMDGTLPLEPAIEKWAMRHAAHLTTVSEPWAETLQRIHHKPVTVIPNGFDDADYPTTRTTVLKPKFTITYTGSLYPQQDPAPLFAAVARLYENEEVSPNEFELAFYGVPKTMSRVRDLTARFGLERFVRAGGLIPVEQSKQKQQTSTVLLLCEWTDLAQRGIYTGKVYEYLAARRPILVVGPAGRHRRFARPRNADRHRFGGTGPNRRSTTPMAA